MTPNVVTDHRRSCLRCQQNSVPNPVNCYEGYILHIIEEGKQAEAERLLAECGGTQ